MTYWIWCSCLLGVLIFTSCRKHIPAPSESAPSAAKAYTDMLVYTSGGSLFSSNIEGGPARKLTNGSSDWFPAISPDATHVAYWSNAGGAYELWLLALESGRKQQLTFFNDQGVPADLQNFNVHNAPSWSPDGAQIVFSRSGTIWVIESSGFNLQTVIADGFNYAPTWSPDGTQLAYVSKRQKTHNLYVRKWGTEEEWNLTNFPTTQSVGGPAWSPDGQTIVFSLATQQEVDIWSIHADGTQLARVTRDKYSNSPAWSPDGKKLAFSSGRQDSHCWEIWIMNPDGSGAFAVTRGSGFSPAWLRQAIKQAIPAATATPKPTPAATAFIFATQAPTSKPTLVPTKVRALAPVKPAATLPSIPTPVAAVKKVTLAPTPLPTATARTVVSSPKPTAVPTKTIKSEEYEDYEEYADDDKTILPPSTLAVESKQNQIIFNPKIDFYFAKDMIKSSGLEG